MLDPADFERFRSLAHRALDEAIDALRDVRDRPVWQPVPESTKNALNEALPRSGMPLESVYEEFRTSIMPFATGNIHPRFLGWVHGTGTPGGMLAEMLAAAMNSNVGGRDHGAVYVERQVIRWFTQLFGWPDTASGILVTGTSMANLLAILVARTRTLPHVRRTGLASGSQLTGYCSHATHACVRKAFEIAGLGAEQLRVLPTDEAHRLDAGALEAAIARDRAAGLLPFIVIGNCGTVDVGAIDPLDELAEIAQREGLWFHVDGAFGALAYLSDALRPMLRGIERADSIAFDFHKWMHVPYDAGCVLIRDGELHRSTFAGGGPYITRMTRGLAAGAPWFADFGPDLSRGFRALKVWFTVKEHGSVGLAAAIERNCAQARLLRDRLERDPQFEVCAPVRLQIVCFRPIDRLRSDPEIDAMVDDAVVALQERGSVVISSTTLNGRRVMRACITNHRTRDDDLGLLLAELRTVLHERTG